MNKFEIPNINALLMSVSGVPLKFSAEQHIPDGLDSDGKQKYSVIPEKKATLKEVLVRSLVRDKDTKEDAKYSFKMAYLAFKIQNCENSYIPENFEEITLLKNEVAKAFPNRDVIFAVWSRIDPNETGNP